MSQQQRRSSNTSGQNDLQQPASSGHTAESRTQSNIDSSQSGPHSRGQERLDGVDCRCDSSAGGSATRLGGGLCRPSLFAQGLTWPREDMLRMFLEDVRRGGLVTGPPPAPCKGARRLRVAQWNVNTLRGPDGSTQQCPEKVAAVLLEFDADVIVVNECCWRPDEHSDNPIVIGFTDALSNAGYRFFVTTDTWCPTLIATRLPTRGPAETVFLVSRSYFQRSALCAQVQLGCGADVIVYGTHLNYSDGDGVDGAEKTVTGIRREEAQRLLRHWEEACDSNVAATLVVADWNQQRRRDYPDDEWAILAASMAKRGEPEDDGVGSLFEQHGFVCSLDSVRAGADCNWESSGFPPPTHWTSTAIDYCFAKGLTLCGAYVIQVRFSDHLPVVTDWELS